MGNLLCRKKEMESEFQQAFEQGPAGAAALLQKLQGSPLAAMDVHQLDAVGFDRESMTASAMLPPAPEGTSLLVVIDSSCVPEEAVTLSLPVQLAATTVVPFPCPPPAALEGGAWLRDAQAAAAEARAQLSGGFRVASVVEGAEAFQVVLALEGAKRAAPADVAIDFVDSHMAIRGSQSVRVGCWMGGRSFCA